MTKAGTRLSLLGTVGQDSAAASLRLGLCSPASQLASPVPGRRTSVCKLVCKLALLYIAHWAPGREAGAGGDGWARHMRSGARAGRAGASSLVSSSAASGFRSHFLQLFPSESAPTDF